MQVAQGSTVTLSGVFVDGAGTPTDATTPTLTVVDSTDTALAGFPVTPTHTGTGTYEYDWAVAGGQAVGFYAASWSGTIAGDLITGYESVEVVAIGSLGIDAYCSLAEFRTWVRTAAVLDDDDDPDTALELLALTSAARAIDLACGRTFALKGAAVSARYFTMPTRPNGLYLAGYPAGYPVPGWQNAILSIDDVEDTTGMTVAFDVTGNGSYTNVVTTYRAGPLSRPRDLPYSQIIFDGGTVPPTCNNGVKVEALWGWTAVPATVKAANMMQAARFLKRRDAPFGVAGSPEMGSEVRLLARLDPDVALMLAPYKRRWGAV